MNTPMPFTSIRRRQLLTLMWQHLPLPFNQTSFPHWGLPNEGQLVCFFSADAVQSGFAKAGGCCIWFPCGVTVVIKPSCPFRFCPLCWCRVSKDLRLPGNSHTRERRVLLPGHDDSRGERVWGKRYRWRVLWLFL